MDLYEKAYGTRTEIFITKAGRSQLRGEGPRKWYEPIRYATKPDSLRCVSTKVGANALKDGVFYPDRYEPDLAAECCEEVKVKPRKAAEKTKPFRKNDRVRQTLHGPGAIVTDGYDSGKVIAVRDGRVSVRWDDSEDRVAPNVYDPKTGWEIEAPFPEMKTRIHHKK